MSWLHELTFRARSQISLVEAGLVPAGKLVMWATLMLPLPRSHAVLPITAFVAVAPLLTGAVKPVESSTFPFMCITQQ